jgi:hypothetical protein
MLDFPDTLPALPTLASFCASAQTRFPPPPDFLLDDPVTVSSARHIEDFVSFLRTGITLATRSAFDGNTVLSTTGQSLSCDDLVKSLIFWTRIAIHGLECSDQDDIGDVGDLIDELNMVIGILIAVDQTRVRVSDQDAKCTILDALRRQFDM